MTEASLTPVMSQYWKIKSQHKDAILFFRLGDFYEMFYEDARIASRELEIALTSRNKDSLEPIPLAGIPHQTYQIHAAKLLKRGYKIAICDQTSDPKKSKGIVERQVVRVLTPGTVTEENLLESSNYNYLLALAREKDRFALAFLDLSTGDAHLTGSRGEQGKELLLEEVLRLKPAEIITSRDKELDSLLAKLSANLAIPPESITRLAGGRELAGTEIPGSLGDLTMLGDSPEKLEAIRLLVTYVKDTLGSAFQHFSRLDEYRLEECLVMDPGSLRNLDLLENSREKVKRGSLFWVMDRTSTSMGTRLLKSWITSPLIHPEKIQARLTSVALLVERSFLRDELRELLKQVHDIPRILAKVSAGQVNARDLSNLGQSLAVLPEVKSRAAEAGLPARFSSIPTFEDLKDRILTEIVESPPITITEGGMFESGVSMELDELRSINSDAKGYVTRLEEEERARTGIRSLRIKYNRVLGYFIEVTKSNLGSVPADYQRKQGFAGGERFVTPRLKEKEGEILQAEDRAKAVEYEMFVGLKEAVREVIQELKALGTQVAELDCLIALALVAVENRYVRPTLTLGSQLYIQGGRHPVVERMLKDGEFHPNDLFMRPDQSQMVILTGPNMAGKSTFLRQAALLIVMAQMGSFVPAERMEWGIVDRIFTRVGASDDLASGQSTFMVEMQETSYILKNGTPSSLVILDEVGRGTSTYDGLSLAWAIVEHLYRVPTLRPKTLFATHYHELTELANLYPGITNLSTKVLEQGDRVIFLHKVVPEAADKSYGIHVAMLAGIPREVIDRAKELLFELEKDEERDIQVKRRRLRSRGGPEDAEQLLLFDPAVHPVLEEIRSLDVESLSPLAALNTLARLKARL